MVYVLDPKLKQYATDKQWVKLEALAEHGSERKAADALGVHRATIWATKAAVVKKAAMHGYSPDHDMVHALPDGYRLKGTSTLYDAQTGEPKIQWVKSEIDKQRQAEIFREVVEALASGLPRVELIPEPSHASEDLMACYPVGDHHLGMLAWHEETGTSYDLSIGEQLLFGATNYLVNSSPACERATIVFLGDFMHYDSFVPVTPTSRNQLDVDSRFPKMVRAAIRSMRHLIETAASKHKQVHVVVEIGNHDLSSSIFLMECLANIYEKESRISIDTSPAHCHYFDFGKCLVGVHHGHGIKMQDLPLIMATDRNELWGKSEYRYWWTGHVHHDQTKDYKGCKVESFRVLPPVDAYAAQKGYRSVSDMKSILLHKKYGEVARNTVNPDMLSE